MNLIPLKGIMSLAMRIMIIIIASFYSLCAQESGKRDIVDSNLTKTPINQYLLRNFQTDIVLPPSLKNSPDFMPAFLRQSMTNIPPSLSIEFQQKVDITSYWKQELAREDEYKTLRLVLGSIQAGGTAYLLYEHIRKYGLK
jgi:hypothetical protein